MTEETSHETATLAYDGRGFLAKARNAVTDCGPVATIPTYDSEGLLYQRQQQNLFTSAVTAQTRVFYFADRPVAQLDGIPATGMLTYLTVDHLGTPILASAGAGTPTWSGGFEPFGRDFSTPSAQSSGIFLRLPGQWDDTVWDSTRFSSGLYYNLNRWYELAGGKYEQPEALGDPSEIGLFGYAAANPVIYRDPLGLSPADVLPYRPNRIPPPDPLWDKCPVRQFPKPYRPVMDPKRIVGAPKTPIAVVILGYINIKLWVCAISRIYCMTQSGLGVCECMEVMDSHGFCSNLPSSPSTNCSPPISPKQPPSRQCCGGS
jgi:RHS repeat-associated protein